MEQLKLDFFTNLSNGFSTVFWSKQSEVKATESSVSFTISNFTRAEYKFSTQGNTELHIGSSSLLQRTPLPTTMLEILVVGD